MELDMSTIFDLQSERNVANEIALGLLQDINNEAIRRAGLHRDSFNAFWHSTEATPQQICQQMGPKAALFFAIASANVQHIAAVAQIAGKTLGDFLRPEEYVPPQTVTINEDGTATIGS